MKISPRHSKHSLCNRPALVALGETFSVMYGIKTILEYAYTEPRHLLDLTLTKLLAYLIFLKNLPQWVKKSSSLCLRRISFKSNSSFFCECTCSFDTTDIDIVESVQFWWLSPLCFSWRAVSCFFVLCLSFLFSFLYHTSFTKPHVDGPKMHQLSRNVVVKFFFLVAAAMFSLFRTVFFL